MPHAVTAKHPLHGNGMVYSVETVMVQAQAESLVSVWLSPSHPEEVKPRSNTDAQQKPVDRLSNIKEGA